MVEVNNKFIFQLVLFAFLLCTTLDYLKIENIKEMAKVSKFIRNSSRDIDCSTIYNARFRIGLIISLCLTRILTSFLVINFLIIHYIVKLVIKLVNYSSF